MTQHATARRVATGTGATLALAVIGVTATGGAAYADDSYTVRKGDTVSHIAARSGSTVAAITRANALGDAARIRVGQVLTIPSSSTPARPPAAPAPTAGSYTVVSGDTVSHIAAKLGTSVPAIVAANGLDARAFIRVGQTLNVPGASTPAAPAPAAAPQTAGSSSYTVRPGDTVSAIATRHGTTVTAVVAANGLGSRALIRIGQTLTIPAAAAAAVAPAAPAAASVGNTFAGRTYADSVVAAANANLATLRASATPSKADMQAKIAATARAMGVDPALAQAVAFQESGFNHAVVSPANAIGAMQVIPTSGQWASDLVGRQLNLVNPDDNVTAGVAILRSLVGTAPDLPTAIAGYYQGASSVKKNGMFADTRRYVANVQTHMTRFR
ncbi:LysM peptidoglycan-binding domain-containing protein [Cellulomonas fengjieae]|uniref:LysM peptidoglycan-binding domain-containing protein n=1 Tax=Cellulomonas fengjieae TaxID=2819978 RepID=UPI001AAE47CA|nr:LysM peptidoglycan-binding domain-containing protein [Cellulomonas fengjieae]MBO3103600.1 LysM peptidoglycan-binding domain-containing protein [Cellulomonas fengjieae]